jgi:hypothetical protein
MQNKNSLENLKGKEEIGCECVNWIHLAQDRDQWWVHVKTVMNFGF